MLRRDIAQRDGWHPRIVDLGLTFQDADGTPYWTEGAYWEFAQTEIEAIELATAELHHMCLAAAEAIVADRAYALLGLDDDAARLVEASWKSRDPYLYGRFDLAYDGSGPPKLLEYNADTPTSLLEAAVIQWDWMEANRRSGALAADIDQFNAIEEALVAAWRTVARSPAFRPPLHFACLTDHDEDRQTTEYLRSAAEIAGIETAILDIRDTGWRDDLGWFVDVAGLPIRTMFKLYPWEYMTAEAFAPHLAARSTLFVEPAWKLMLQSKGLLAVLWDMFPGHPNLLPASRHEDDVDGARVRKPMFSREGANIAVTHPLGPYSLTVETGGDYGREGHVWQAWAPLAQHGSGHAVIGSWITSGNPRFAGLPRHPMGGDPCGMAIREHAGLVTGNLSRIVPHLFVPDPSNPPIPANPATGEPLAA
jgi:glutathionylspermidine synthase